MKLFPWGVGTSVHFLGIGEGVNLTGVLLTRLWCLFQTWPCRSIIHLNLSGCLRMLGDSRKYPYL